MKEMIMYMCDNKLSLSIGNSKEKTIVVDVVDYKGKEASICFTQDNIEQFMEIVRHLTKE